MLDDSQAPEDLDVAEEVRQITTHRGDRVSSIVPDSGYWGAWKQDVYCNPGTYVSGYQMRVEGSQGGGDDTALNAVRLQCSTPAGSYTEWIASHEGVWGDWYPSAACPSFVTGGRMSIESRQGSGDDTAANDVELLCSDGGSIHAPGGMSWGDWQDWQECPAGTAVCGISVRFEDPIGSGDDTAMNGMELYCCSLSHSCHRDVPGGWDYCSRDCPCEDGEGDCDSDDECKSEFTCVRDIGAYFGWDYYVDVCIGLLDAEASSPASLVPGSQDPLSTGR